MKKWITILAGLLALQLVLAVAFNVSEEDYGSFQADEKLFALDFETIDRVQFDDGSQSVTLEKQDGQWVLPETWNYPVNSDALVQLMDTLSALNKGWPVATSPGAAERFKVAKNVFERKISFWSEAERQTTLYVGTSPGFRKVHVRLEGNDPIYAVVLENWKTSAQTDDWLKKDILKIDATDIEQLSMAGFVLIRSDQTLQPKDLSEDEKPNPDTIDSLVNSLAGLPIESVQGIEGNEGFPMDEPKLTINVVLKNDDKFDYEFFKPEEESSHYFLKRSDLPYYFTVAEPSINTLLETKRGRLIQESSDNEQETPELDSLSSH